MNASQYSSRFYWITPWIHTFWDQISGTYYWLTLAVWKPLRLWKAFYHGPQVSSAPGKPVLKWLTLSILTISTGSSLFYTLSPYILLLSMSFTLCFNIGLDSFSVTVWSEKTTNWAYVAKMVRCHHPSHNSATFRSLSTATLGAAPRVRRTVSRCFAALRLLSHVRRQVNNDCFRFLVVSLVHSRLDYGNFLFVGLPAYLQWRLQYVLDAAARLIFRFRRYDHVSGALAILYWLCLPERVNLNWRLWHTKCWTVWRYRIWTNLFLYSTCQVVAICGRRSRCSCTSRSTACQQPAVAHSL